MNNFNNDIYREALEKIKRDKKCIPKFPIITGIIGPTGPTGPAGAATITIGTVTTGDPGTEASVTNSGTSENVV